MSTTIKSVVKKAEQVTQSKTVQKRLTKTPASRRSLSTMPTQFPDINARITEIRHQSGLTQVEFAKRLGINKSTLKRIESGTVNPNLYTLQQLRYNTMVSLDYIICGIKVKKGS